MIKVSITPPKPYEEGDVFPTIDYVDINDIRDNYPYIGGYEELNILVLFIAPNKGAVISQFDGSPQQNPFQHGTNFNESICTNFEGSIRLENVL